MKRSIFRPRLIILALGTSLAFAHMLGSVSPWVDSAFFIVFVLVLGIPHGAVDHLVAEALAKTKQKSFSMMRFLLTYLLQMVIYAVLWYFFPALSLWIFLLMSAWHFGESDMQPAPTHPLWKAAQALLGGCILFYILMRQPEFVADIISRITRGDALSASMWAYLSSNAMVAYAVLIGLLAIVALLAYRAEPMHLPFAKWGYLGLILILIYFLPLLPAFALYFGGWHSVNTFKHISDYLNRDRSVAQLWKAALPFTLLAFLFLIATAAIWFFALSHLDPVPVLFIFIAIITLPHLVVMHGMFRKG